MCNGNERHPNLTTASAASTGIPDPDDPDHWLVRPWPVRAGFHEVVHHFLMAYTWRLDSADTVRRLAYFEGYLAALKAAPTAKLTYPADWRWRDELLSCVGDCVTQFRDKGTAQGHQAKATPTSAGAPTSGAHRPT
jgi:hypothetical protein